MHPWVARGWRWIGRPVDESHDVQIDWMKDHLGRIFLADFTWWAVLWLPALVIVGLPLIVAACLAVGSAFLFGVYAVVFYWMIPYGTSLTAAELQAAMNRRDARNASMLAVALGLACVTFAVSALVYAVSGKPLYMSAALLAVMSAALPLRLLRQRRVDLQD